MTHFLVTGASGLLGLNFCSQTYQQQTVTGVVNQHGLKNAPFTVLAVDLSAPGQAAILLDQIRPDVVLHCAAMANIDQCERSPELAWRVNADLPGELARETARRGIQLVHISTDAVFDGVRGSYTEEDAPNPLSVYARSKLAGEQQVAEANPLALIARVNFYGWSLSGKRSLGEFFYYNLSAGKPVKGFTDVIFSPLEVSQLVQMLLKLVEQRCSGLYHVLSSESWSKYAFGKAIADRFGLDAGLIEPVSVMQGGLQAARSPNLNLRTDKLARVLGQPAPRLADGIEIFYAAFQAGIPQQMQAFGAE